MMKTKELRAIQKILELLENGLTLHEATARVARIFRSNGLALFAAEFAQDIMNDGWIARGSK